MRKDRIDTFGAVMLVAQSAALGINQVLIKLVNAGMEPAFQAGLRSLCAAPLVLAYAVFRKKRLSVRDGSLLPGVLCGLFFATEFVLLFYGLSLTSVARASILFYTMPVWLAIVAHFVLGERLSLARVVGLTLALCGVSLALGAGAGEGASLIGDLMCLLAAFFWMGIALIARISRLRTAAPEMQLIYQLVVSAPVLLLISMVPGQFAFAMTTKLWLVFVIQVVGVATIAYLAWFWVLSIYPASDMASFGFLAPMFGVFFGWVILEEALQFTDLAALVLVALGILLVNRKPKRTAP